MYGVLIGAHPGNKVTAVESQANGTAGMILPAGKIILEGLS